MRILLLSLLTIATLATPLAGFADDSSAGNQEPVLILTSPGPDQGQTQSWTSSQSDSSQSQPNLQLSPQPAQQSSQQQPQQQSSQPQSHWQPQLQTNNQVQQPQAQMPSQTPQAAAVKQVQTSSTQPLAVAEKPKMYGPTTRSVPIWDLAIELRPSEAVTVQQMIIALQKANPEAFEHNNINALKSGQMLRVPTLAEIKLTSPDAAMQQVDMQNKTWKSEQLLALTEAAKAKSAEKAQAVEKSSEASSPAITTIAKLSVPSESAASTKETTEMTQQQAPLVALKTELTTTQQELTQDQDETEKSLGTLQQQDQNLTSKLHQVENKVTGLSVQTATLTQQVDGNWYEKLMGNHLQNKAVWWFIGVALLLIILLWLPMPKSNNAKRREPVLNGNDLDVKNEYDYMNSDEAIPAKLDLARAYIDMDDHLSAEQVLKDVVAKGDEKQRQHAKRLMDELKV